MSREHPSTRPATRRTIPAGECFWAVVDAPGVRRPGAASDGIMAIVQDELPVPAESLHAAVMPIPTADRPARVAVCAVKRTTMESLPSEIVSCTPESVPNFVGGTVSPEHVELRSGAFEAPARLRRRFQLHVLVAGLSLLACLLVATGLARRSAAWSHEQAELRTSTAALLQAHGTNATLESLMIEAARARTASAAEARPPLADASVTLASLLRTWPVDVPIAPPSIAVGTSTLTVSLTVEGPPEDLLRRLAPPSGWTLDEPRLATAGGKTRITLPMTRRADQAAGSVQTGAPR